MYNKCYKFLKKNHYLSQTERKKKREHFIIRIVSWEDKVYRGYIKNLFENSAIVLQKKIPVQ